MGMLEAVEMGEQVVVVHHHLGSPVLAAGEFLDFNPKTCFLGVKCFSINKVKSAWESVGVGRDFVLDGYRYLDYGPHHHYVETQ